MRITERLPPQQRTVPTLLEPFRQRFGIRLVAFCEPRLAYFAIPGYVDFLDALPLTSNGNVLQR